MDKLENSLQKLADSFEFELKIVNCNSLLLLCTYDKSVGKYIKVVEKFCNYVDLEKVLYKYKFEMIDDELLNRINNDLINYIDEVFINKYGIRWSTDKYSVFKLLSDENGED